MLLVVIALARLASDGRRRRARSSTSWSVRRPARRSRASSRALAYANARVETRGPVW